MSLDYQSFSPDCINKKPSVPVAGNSKWSQHEGYGPAGRFLDKLDNRFSLPITMRRMWEVVLTYLTHLWNPRWRKFWNVWSYCELLRRHDRHATIVNVNKFGCSTHHVQYWLLSSEWILRWYMGPQIPTPSRLTNEKHPRLNRVYQSCKY